MYMALPTPTMPFDPSQEMSRRSMLIRHYLDESSPRVPFHAHPFFELYFFLEGNLDCYVVGGKSYTMKPGDILIIPPGVPHHPIFLPKDMPYRRYVLWLAEDHLHQMAQLDNGLPAVLNLCRDQENYRIRCSNPAAVQALEGQLRTMWEEERGNSSCKNALLYSICLQFLVLLNRVVTDERSFSPCQHYSDNLLDNVLEYIHANYSSDISLNTVAEQFFSSPSTIENLLVKKLGKPFYRYVTECRIIHAQALITDGMPLKEVGHACGYNDYSNFYRAFTREVGISPSKFRTRLPREHFVSGPTSKHK